MPSKAATQIHRRPRPGPGMARPKSEGGAIAIMTAVVLVVLIGMFGFALDLSRSYNRKMELQSMADAAALAAANALDGTEAGVDNAVAAAASTVAALRLSYNNSIFAWSSDALTFGTAPGGGSKGWLGVTDAKASAGKVFFARVDTTRLDSSHGEVDNILMPILSAGLAVTNVVAAAVAGRDYVGAMPLAICANSTVPAAPITYGELSEFGFRRGISYDLMNISPTGGSAQNFLVNPVAPAGTSGASMADHMDMVAAAVCTGRMAIPSLQGGQITVEPGFPIGTLNPQLNVRFGMSASPCQPSSSPADANTTSYDLASANWIQAQPPGLSVGPIWSYAKAVKYTAYANAKGIEPPAGYATYSTTEWASLYPGPPVAKPKSYPSLTPYQSTAAGAGAYKTPYNTRVLRIPLLQCPVTSTKATVVGVGRFFMTTQATSTSLVAEFAGVEPWTAIGGNARLYQ